MFSFTRFYLRVLADLNEIIRRLKRNVIMTMAIYLEELKGRYLQFLVQRRNHYILDFPVLRQICR